MNIKIIQKFDNFTATPHQKVVAVKTQEEAEDKIITEIAYQIRNLWYDGAEIEISNDINEIKKGIINGTLLSHLADVGVYMFSHNNRWEFTYEPHHKDSTKKAPGKINWKIYDCSFVNDSSNEIAVIARIDTHGFWEESNCDIEMSLEEVNKIEKMENRITQNLADVLNDYSKKGYIKKTKLPQDLSERILNYKDENAFDFLSLQEDNIFADYIPNGEAYADKQTDDSDIVTMSYWKSFIVRV